MSDSRHDDEIVNPDRMLRDLARYIAKEQHDLAQMDDLMKRMCWGIDNGQPVSLSPYAPAPWEVAKPKRPQVVQDSTTGPKRSDVASRVEEAHKLLKNGSASSAVFGGLSGTDRRTYKKHCKAVTGEDPLI